MSNKHHPVDDYVSTFVTLKPESIGSLLELVAEDVVFTDPFNTVHGKRDFRRIFDHMFESCTDPQFKVSDVAHSSTASYLRWQMTGRLKRWPYTNLFFDGMTEVHIDEQGKISRHIDHWDSASQLMRYLPFIGAIIRPILKLFQLKPVKKQDD